MTQQAAVATVRAEQIEGLRELIAQVIAEEGERLIPRRFLADVEKIKRSPVGAVIRMEGDIQHLRDGLEALRVEMKAGQEALRTGFKKDLANLEQVMLARFEGVNTRFEGVNTRFEGVNTRFEGVNAHFNGVEKLLQEQGRRISLLQTLSYAMFGLIFSMQVALLIKIFF